MTARKVTIEGSRLHPTDLLASGEKRTVALTDRVQRLIDRGYVVVIEDESDAPEPADAPNGTPASTEPTAPKRSASRDEWAAFLDGLDPAVEFTDDDGRDDLIAKYDDRVAAQS
ncbi:hypothetical protein SEA_CAIB_23 [Gordonia phage CaiB]|nr:hypothetical protein SEA_CAIB_23 [Gordonia phage CaiB]